MIILLTEQADPAVRKALDYIHGNLQKPQASHIIILLAAGMWRRPSCIKYMPHKIPV